MTKEMMIEVVSSIKVDNVQTGSRIKEFMREHNLSVSDVAEACDISNVSVYKWFRGESCPTIENLMRLSMFMTEDMDEMVFMTRRQRKSAEGGSRPATAALSSHSQNRSGKAVSKRCRRRSERGGDGVAA